jgi:hypothetical protein
LPIAPNREHESSVNLAPAVANVNIELGRLRSDFTFLVHPPIKNPIPPESFAVRV